MNKFKLKLYPDSVLREIAFPVLNMNGNIYDLLNAMSEIMYKYEGISLAAPQVGALQQDDYCKYWRRFAYLNK